MYSLAGLEEILKVPPLFENWQEARSADHKLLRKGLSKYTQTLKEIAAAGEVEKARTFFSSNAMLYGEYEERIMLLSNSEIADVLLRLTYLYQNVQR